MNFLDLNLQEEYDSISNDVYNEFFNVVLPLTKQYARIGGIFTSRNFAACAEGLQEFIQNDGRMQLVLTPSFEKEDADAINRGIKNADDVISENWIKNLTEIKDKFQKEHTKALAWMLANKYLEIRVVILTREDGTVVDLHELEKMNIFKRKTGIFWDKNYNAITFSGNIDFDDKLFGDYYFFRVYRSWDESEKKWVDDDFEEFQRFWNGKTLGNSSSGYLLKTIPLPNAIRNDLVKLSPTAKSEIKLVKPPKLRPYQQTAVKKWLENNKLGIFAMATGTGKTFTAIGCLKEVEKSGKKVLGVIVCPYDNLMRQWEKELSKWNYESIITAKDPKWHQTMRDNIAILENKDSKGSQVIITSYATFSSEKFISLIKLCKIPTILIADEVHHSGSTENSKGLIEEYRYRLGLSATIERYFDPEGTRLIDNYFGNIVFELDLEEAIEKKFLVGYYYYPIYVNLNPDEYIQYKKETAKIARYWNSDDPKDHELYLIALQKRARIIRDAANKLVAFEELIQRLENIKHTLIYCSENQMQEVKNILNNIRSKPIINRQITADNPKDPRDRNKILRDLAEEKYQAIVANLVLDEGADIPEAKTCIMLASSGNPKQFIQRRGRVLRKFHGTYKDGTKKEHAIIYDILIVPELSADYTEDEIRVESSIIKSQLDRQEEMGSIAINRDECLKDIKSIKAKFRIN